jgi:hypothetical protein
MGRYIELYRRVRGMRYRTPSRSGVSVGEYAGRDIARRRTDYQSAYIWQIWFFKMDKFAFSPALAVAGTYRALTVTFTSIVSLALPTKMPRVGGTSA